MRRNVRAPAPPRGTPPTLAAPPRPHLQPLEHLVDEELDPVLTQLLVLHELPQVGAHERHHQVTAGSGRGQTAGVTPVGLGSGPGRPCHPTAPGPHLPQHCTGLYPPTTHRALRCQAGRTALWGLLKGGLGAGRPRLIGRGGGERKEGSACGQGCDSRTSGSEGQAGQVDGDTGRDA